MSASTGRVLAIPDDLDLPGSFGADTLALAGVDRHVFDAIAHDHGAVDQSGAMRDQPAFTTALLTACALAPLLDPVQARTLVDQWPSGEVEWLLEECLRLCLPEPVDRAWWRLETEPRLRAEMDYCAPLGLPHSHFLGGPADWSAHDRELAMGWAMRKAQTCPGCGTRRDQWERDRQAFDAELYDCPGCFLRAAAEKQLPDESRAHVHVHLAPAVDDPDGDDD